MLRLDFTYDNLNLPELRKRLGNEAKRFITDHFSTEYFRSSVQRFMR